jgi:hypothetical protein
VAVLLPFATASLSTGRLCCGPVSCLCIHSLPFIFPLPTALVAFHALELRG